MATRRDFLKTGALAGAGALLAKGGTQKALAVAPAGGTPKIAPFKDALIASIPKATKITPSPYPGADYYEIRMSLGSHQFHSQLPGPAATLRYEPMPYLGPIIEAQKNTPVVVKFINNLPATEAQHPLASSIDPTVPDPNLAYFGRAANGDPLPPPGGRAVPHLHGGYTPPQFDGHPHAWFTPDGKRGSHYGSLTEAGPNEAILVYPNGQPAANIWYHDHAMGITRLNVYAGLAGLYFVRDGDDTGNTSTGLHLPADPYEIPLVIQDKQFNANGTLFYPTTGITAVHPTWVPEFFGDTPVVNAVAYPFLNVEPRRYRFRIVNGAQARFFNLSLNGPGNLPMWLIGMEQSLLPKAVRMSSLLLAPGERADVIVDFTGRVGATYTLKNNAKAPYPGGRGGTMPDIMQFRVNVSLAAGGDTSMNPAVTPTLISVPRLAPTPDAPNREIVMKEDVDPLTGLPIDMTLNGKMFGDTPIDETPKVGDTEIWQFINLTVDAHPMHMHLVKFQVYNRQPFNAKAYTVAWNQYIASNRNPALKPVLTNYLAGAAVAPPPDEMGWKDTAKAYPDQILRVIAKFELQQTDIPGIAGTAAQLPAEYVYHCHILEHEENEMMRPFVVTETGSLPKKGVEEETTSTKPMQFGLDQNYPNPFNPETTIRFQLSKDSPVKLRVFNTAGQEVAKLVDGNLAAGSHVVSWNANTMASGAYFYRLEAGTFSAVKSMLLLK